MRGSFIRTSVENVPTSPDSKYLNIYPSILYNQSSYAVLARDTTSLLKIYLRRSTEIAVNASGTPRDVLPGDRVSFTPLKQQILITSSVTFHVHILSLQNKIYLILFVFLSRRCCSHFACPWLLSWSHNLILLYLLLKCPCSIIKIACKWNISWNTFPGLMVMHSILREPKTYSSCLKLHLDQMQDPQTVGSLQPHLTFNTTVQRARHRRTMGHLLLAPLPSHKASPSSSSVRKKTYRDAIVCGLRHHTLK